MKPFCHIRLFLFNATILTLLIVSIGCQRSLPKHVNDGYGDYVFVPAGELMYTTCIKLYNRY